MSVTLCIDQGNTLTKACIFDNDSIVCIDSFEKEDSIARVRALIDTYHPEGAILCSVTNDNSLLDMLNQYVSHVHVLSDDSSLPIINVYSSPETLGADRLALAVGVFAAYPNSNAMAISVGTCITYNLVLSNKAFRGVAISPGMNMRFKALQEHTDKLPLVKPDGDLLLLGYDTETSIRSGVINGMAAEIDGMVAAFAAQYPDFNAVLTGGDAPTFANKMKSKIFADPNLLMKGLNLILKHNVPQLQ